ncbi:DUF6318 family protein [Jiangella asiatica]|uniref:Nuclear transport factor 2 family protein n=1 Tax=Jiangella asiatica TaxID=2530372 RepID=A0A4R5DEJ2_9ACTN|nr:DUF6318 family protein [Jiangella asiatica]TDE12199.1 hypothetical protein E1269_07865 [Jiangella asiatica]
MMTLVGCADEPAETSTSTANTGSAEPTSDDDGEPTTAPAEAGEDSEAGAEAFVRYYLEALSDGYNHLAVGEIRAHALEACVTCHEWADAYAGTMEQGGTIVSGDATWRVGEIVVSSYEAGANAEVSASVTIGEHTFTESATATPVARPEVTFHFEFVVVRQDDSWAVEEMAESQM